MIDYAELAAMDEVNAQLAECSAREIIEEEVSKRSIHSKRAHLRNDYDKPLSPGRRPKHLSASARTFRPHYTTAGGHDDLSLMTPQGE